MNSIKYSYIDRLGNVAIDAGEYCRAYGFSEGLALVGTATGGWGYIDTSGRLLIEPQFYSAMGFSEELAAVCTGDKWGLIDKAGHIVIEPRYEEVSPFSEGMAVALIGDTSLLIDKTGQIILSRSTDELFLSIYEDARFSEGLAVAYDCAEEKYGFIDRSGEFIIEPRFQQAAPFSEGLARVAVVEEDEEKLAFIDHGGRFAIPPRFNTDFDFRRNSTNFSEGLASLSEGLRPVVIEAEKFVYVDKSGEIILPTDFFYAGPFREGRAVVYDAERNKWGFINRLGEAVVPLRYDLANDFSDGFACVATYDISDVTLDAPQD
jgi:hypothetical protein